MSVKRSQIVRGGGRALFKTIPIYTEDDIDLQITVKTVPLKVAMLGKISDTQVDVMVDITLTPSGEITAGLIALYQSFFAATMYPGQSIFDPVIDYPMVINSRDGKQLTIVNVAMTQPPAIMRVAGKTVWGPAKFIGLRANGADWNAANSLIIPGSADYPGDAAFSKNNINRQPAVGRWGAVVPTSVIATATAANPTVLGSVAHGLVDNDSVAITGSLGDATLNGAWFVVNGAADTFELSATKGGEPINTGGAYTANSATFIRTNLGDSFGRFSTEAGFAVTPNVSLTPDLVDGVVNDMIFDSVTLKAEAIPAGPTLDDALGMLNIQGGANVIGQDVGALGLPLYLSAAGFYLKLPLAALLAEGISYSPTKKRLQKLSWESEMSFDEDGVPVPLLEISTAVIA